MKKTLIMMAVATIGLTSCQKDELAQPTAGTEVNRPGNNFNIVDSLDYTLDFRCDTLNINVKYLHSYQYRHLLYSMAPNPMMQIGKVFKFRMRDGSNFTVCFEWNGVRRPGDISGNAGGYTFGDMTALPINGTLNMCGYVQNAPYTFTLKNYKGEIVMTNVSNAVSK
jgi:hypothetical protein